jgi:hypothetical protein
MTEPTRTEGKPHDRLTRMCDAMTNTLDTHPEHQDGDRAIVMLDDGTNGGIVLHGYDNDIAAITDLLVHLRAIFRANGKDLDIIGIPDSPESLLPE